MDLFDVVNLEVPTSVTVTLRPLEENERPVLKASEGRLVGLNIPNAGDGPSAAAAPIQQVPPQQEPVVEEEPLVEQEPVVEQVAPQVTPIDVEESVEKEDPVHLKRKNARDQDEGESSKKVRHEAEVEHPEAGVEKP